MQVSEAVIDRLVESGIDTLFGIPGKQSLPLDDAIDARDDVRFVMARHETAVSHNAWGHAATGGGMAATIVIPGPGDMNAMNGLKNALNDCVPLLHIAVETEPGIRGGDGIHETPPETYDTVVKANVLVETPESTVAELARAIRIARTPPRGPVRIGIPKNFLPADAEVAEPGAVRPVEPTGVPGDRVERAADLLAAAEAPVIVAGGGVRAAGAAAELRAVAEALSAPVVPTYKGKGTIPDDHDLTAGVLCGGASSDLTGLLADADAALGVGTDFDAVTTRGWSVDLPDDLVHVTLSSSDVGTGYEPAVGIVADARRTLAALSDALGDRAVASGDGAARARAVRAADADRLADLRAVAEPPFTSVAALVAVREAVPREAAVGIDAGGFRIWSLVAFDAYGPDGIATPGSWATMGTGLPSAIGAALAEPDRPAVALTGDGGLLMCVHELHTLADEGLDVAVVVLNDSDYAIISEEAERSYRMEPGEYGWADTPVDFTAVAEGLGLPATRATTPDGIREAVGAAVDRDGPALVEIPTDPSEPQASEWMRDRPATRRPLGPKRKLQVGRSASS